MTEWEFIKGRTAADGAVWRSADGLLFKRTGGPDVSLEAAFQTQLHQLGFPVPEIVSTGTEGEQAFFVERTAGSASVHDLALAAADRHGMVPQEILHAAFDVTAQLLAAQQRNAQPANDNLLRGWFTKASFVDNVWDENRDFDTARVREVIEHVLRRLGDLPMCHSHMDYGLPNAFPSAVIDWQHFGSAPLGYDVYPMLEIAAFKGGNRGYRFTAEQTARFRGALDEVMIHAGGAPLSGYRGEFLLVKCFFFLALMRPSDTSTHDKHLKWQYRRELFWRGLDQYEATGVVDTSTFPTLAEFARAENGSGALTSSP